MEDYDHTTGGKEASLGGSRPETCCACRVCVSGDSGAAEGNGVGWGCRCARVRMLCGGLGRLTDFPQPFVFLGMALREA